VGISDERLKPFAWDSPPDSWTHFPITCEKQGVQTKASNEAGWWLKRISVILRSLTEDEGCSRFMDAQDAPSLSVDATMFFRMANRNICNRRNPLLCKKAITFMATEHTRRRNRKKKFADFGRGLSRDLLIPFIIGYSAT